ncbi:MAG: thiol-disulfide oxidoreductase DCC family protein [Gammaproteobacteria bacterium]
MNANKITVYYDGACPRCLKELAFYEFFDRNRGVEWFDIVGNEPVLREHGIDPDEALQRLHLRMPDGTVVKDMDAFIVLWRQVLIFRPLAWLLAVPPLKAFAEKNYARLTLKRLRRQGRLCTDRCKLPQE